MREHPREEIGAESVDVIFYMGCAFFLAVLVVSMGLAVRGNLTAKYFLWAWAALMTLALPLINRAHTPSYIAAGLMLSLLIGVLYRAVRSGMRRVDVSHDETRRVLAESNRRIDEERQALARRLHDEVNPQLLLARNVLKRLEPMMSGNAKATELLGSASGMLNTAYAEMRDIIKNTRIEVIDSIGFTAALESLVTHYTTITEKPAITLKHNLPKRPPMPEASAISAYKVVREAILNAIKHSNATRVQVNIQCNEGVDSYRVEIVDNGCGMRVGAGHEGIGLIDMRERVLVLGGSLKVCPADPGNQKRPGTKISFSFSVR